MSTRVIEDPGAVICACCLVTVSTWTEVAIISLTSLSIGSAAVQATWPRRRIVTGACLSSDPSST